MAVGLENCGSEELYLRTIEKKGRQFDPMIVEHMVHIIKKDTAYQLHE